MSLLPTFGEQFTIQEESSKKCLFFDTNVRNAAGDWALRAEPCDPKSPTLDAKFAWALNHLPGDEGLSLEQQEWRGLINNGRVLDLPGWFTGSLSQWPSGEPVNGYHTQTTQPDQRVHFYYATETPDGTRALVYTAPVGGREGYWALAGDRLTVANYVEGAANKFLLNDYPPAVQAAPTTPPSTPTSTSASTTLAPTTTTSTTPGTSGTTGTTGATTGAANGWGPWCGIIMKDPNVKAGGIWGKDGARWCSSGVQMSEKEAADLARGIKDPGLLQANGINVGGVKYMFLTSHGCDPSLPSTCTEVTGRKGPTTILATSTKNGLGTVVALTKDGANPGNITVHQYVVEALVLQGSKLELDAEGQEPAGLELGGLPAEEAALAPAAAGEEADGEWDTYAAADEGELPFL